MRFLFALLPLVAMVAADPINNDYDFSSSDINDAVSDFSILAGDDNSYASNNIDDDYETEAGSRSKMMMNYPSISSSSSRYGSNVGGAVAVGEYEKEDVNTKYHQELPLGLESANVLKQLARFDKSEITADRFSRYEVNPDFDLDQSRSLNLKMSPILNYQQSRLIVRSPIQKQKLQTILIKLSKVGIKPNTFKKYLKMKKQGYLSRVHSPVMVMKAIQQGLSTQNIQQQLAVGQGIGQRFQQGGWSNADNVNAWNTWNTPSSSSSLPSTYANVWGNENIEQPSSSLLSSLSPSSRFSVDNMNIGVNNQPSSLASSSWLSSPSYNRDAFMNIRDNIGSIATTNDNINNMNMNSVDNMNANYGGIVGSRAQFRDVGINNAAIGLTSTSNNVGGDVSRGFGFIVPNIQLANELKDIGVTISTTTNNQPAVEANHLQKVLLNCESLNFNSSACTKLQQFSSSILGDVSSPSKLHDSILALTNPNNQIGAQFASSVSMQ